MSSNPRISHPVVNRIINNDADQINRLANSVSGILGGATNNVLDVTLTPSATTTIVKDPRLTFQSHYTFMPVTANARTALSGLFVSTRAKGSVTLTHASNAATDQTFTMSVSG